MEGHISSAVEIANRCGIDEEEFVKIVKVLFRG